MGFFGSSPVLRQRQMRSGVTSVLAMLYMVLFAVLALGYYASMTTNTEISNNELRRIKALAAAESGMDFMRYQLFQTKIPPTTIDADVLKEVQKDLAVQLNGTPNMGTKIVGLDAAATEINVPSGKEQFIKVGADGAKFRATITRSNRQIIVKVTGAYSDTATAIADKAAVQLTYDNTEIPTDFFQNGLASKSTVVIAQATPITGSPSSHANILTTSAANPPVTIGSAGNPATLAGDISVLNTLTPTISAGSSVGGTTNQYDIATNHVHHINPADPPEFPTPNTLIYKQFATNPYVSGHGSYENILIPANTNPNFNSGTILQGVIYIQQPNQVKFNGGVTIQGIIVSDNSGIGNLVSNTLSFQGNGGIKQGIDSLPDLPQFMGLKALGNTAFVLAPGFNVTFTGNFGSLAGHILGDQVTFSGSSDAEVTGSVISLKGPLTFNGTGKINLKLDPNLGHAGLRFSDRYTPLRTTYDEVKP
jgi:hypothetical protein